MVVTKATGGYLFHCHRCHTSGFVHDNLSPKDTIKMMRRPDAEAIREYVKPELPHDFKLITDYQGSRQDRIPWVAYNHMAKYGLREPENVLFNVGWSDTWQRVIIPLYEYQDRNRTLVGWVGRDPRWKKGEIKFHDVPKWVTRSQRDERRYFTAPGDQDVVVLVEDAISAMKVWQATGYTAIALLQTGVADDLMRKLRDKKIYVWLDGDMLAHSVQTVERMRQLGLNARNIHTTKDPKDYNHLAICVHLGKNNDNGEEDKYAVAGD
jgi:hypothetical protein